MNPQKDDIITRQELERHTEEEDNQWILKSPMTISKTESLSASIVTSTDTWQRNANWKRRNEKHECVLNVTRRGTLPKIAEESR